MKQRLHRIREYMKEAQIDGIIIGKPENRYYFSGFSGTAGSLLISQSKAVLLTDSRYVEQATQQAPFYQVIRYDNGTSSLFELLQQIAGNTGLNKIGFESDYTSFDVYRSMKEILYKLDLVPIHLDSLRMIKDSYELSCIKKAADIADRAFMHILSYLRPGIAEQEVATELEFTMRKLGAEKIAFDTIVASGTRGALPHGRASNKLLEKGDFVTMDFGAVYQGYHSDITRTVVIGKATPEQRKVYDVVLRAQLAGAQATKAKQTGKDVDEIARKIIIHSGYGEYFGHGLGHGVGLVIHEEPRLSPSNTGTKLAENMVVTVEPGIYIPGWGGIRIEDTVVVGTEGSKPLTVSSKQLIEL